MVIANPSVWKQPYWSGKVGSPKYDKILEIIADLNAISVTPPLHASTHENTGADEINVGGLSGVLADNQNFSLVNLFATVTDLTGSTTWPGGAFPNQTITYLVVPAYHIGDKYSLFSFRLINNHGVLNLTGSWYYSDDDATNTFLGSFSVLPAGGFQQLNHNFDIRSDNKGNDLRYYITVSHSLWTTSTYTHASLRTGLPVEEWT